MKIPRTLLALPVAMAAFASPAGTQVNEAAYSTLSTEDRQVAREEGGVYGRLRHIEGELDLRRAGERLDELAINEPIAPGDVLTTGSYGRAEVQLADGSILILDADTELVLQSLSDRARQIEDTTLLQLGYGSLIVRPAEIDSGQKRFQIDTEAASIFLLSDGQFRIDVRDDGTAVVSSRRGVAEVLAEEISSIVRSGERVTVRPGSPPGDPKTFNTRLGDELDEWVLERDDVLARGEPLDSESPVGLPEAVEPYAVELSHYGHWYNNPSYGWVWRPVGLVSGWQPYLHGRWVYSPTGLVWVSSEPWGWAPFHYGRWEFLFGSGWVWIPGHVFSGAYVAWGVAPGYFGWCPLGYYDYPVRFTFGVHRTPWVYVRGHQLYHPRVHTHAVRDLTVIRELEAKRVIMRGHPRINPRRVNEAPRLAEELHQVAGFRKELQLKEDPTGRRVAFREQERQRLVEMNNRRIRGGALPRASVARGGASGKGGSVRDDAGYSTERRPQQGLKPTDSRAGLRRQEQARPGGDQRPDAIPRRARPGVRPGEAERDQPPARVRVQPRQAGATGGARRVAAPPPSRQMRPAGQPRLEMVKGGSMPERVIPRILPRPRASNQDSQRQRQPGVAPRGQARPEATYRRPQVEKPSSRTQRPPDGSGGRVIQPRSSQGGGPRPQARPSGGSQRENRGGDRGGKKKGEKD